MAPSSPVAGQPTGRPTPTGGLSSVRRRRARARRSPAPARRRRRSPAPRRWADRGRRTGRRRRLGQEGQVLGHGGVAVAAAGRPLVGPRHVAVAVGVGALARGRAGRRQLGDRRGPTARPGRHRSVPATAPMRSRWSPMWPSRRVASAWSSSRRAVRAATSASIRVFSTDAARRASASASVIICSALAWASDSVVRDFSSAAATTERASSLASATAASAVRWASRRVRFMASPGSWLLPGAQLLELAS